VTKPMKASKNMASDKSSTHGFNPCFKFIAVESLKKLVFVASLSMPTIVVLVFKHWADD